MIEPQHIYDKAVHTLRIYTKPERTATLTFGCPRCGGNVTADLTKTPPLHLTCPSCEAQLVLRGQWTANY